MTNGTTTSGTQNSTPGAPPATGAPAPAGESLSEWIDKYWKLYKTSILGAFGVLVIIVVLVVVWNVLPSGNAVSNAALDHKILPSGDVGSSAALDDFERNLAGTIQEDKSDFAFWYRVNIIIQATLIITALFATIMAAITTSLNADRYKKYLVILTALTASLASVQTTFRLRENLSTFIGASESLKQLESEYEAEKAAKEKIIPRELLELQGKYMKRYLDIEADRMRAWASIGQPAAETKPPPEKPAAEKPAAATKPGADSASGQ